MNNLISAFIGAIIAIMIMLNGTLSKATGNYTSTVIIHIAGLLSIIFILLMKKLKVSFDRNIPLYLYSAGAIGVFTVLFNNIGFETLGASVTIALGLFGQTLSSIIIDHFGLLEMNIIRFEKSKLVGLAFITFGICIMTIF